ncbi:C-type lectin domain family 12 member B-like [Nelusetta ayraudi]|uniref:C-type lectin domain family 12 member B-like n=1 Tax=Nelusetta ayraudi TaxID=303726 RepID=UPI003F6F9C75
MEELNYVAVTFRTDGAPIYEKPHDSAVIYEEVKPRSVEPDAHTGSRSGAPVPPLLLRAVAAGLTITCLILLSIVIALTVHFNMVISEQKRTQSDLTEQIERLQGLQVRLEREAGEQSGERDRLNWTLGVILEHQNFPVAFRCPNGVCKPCPAGWLLFQSMCYLITEHIYSWEWKTWEGSRHSCRELSADLVMIDSQEEQEFISNNTEFYNDYRHGYWIGYSRVEDTWMWTGGSNGTLTFWTQQNKVYGEKCALTLRLDSLDNWRKTSCHMKNRWICEMRTLIK